MAAAPESAIPNDKGRGKNNPPPKRLSRLEYLRREQKDPEYEPDMPPVDGAPHIIGYLFEIGPVMSTGMGPGPIIHAEILAWSGLTGIDLHPWESRFIRRLSHEYLETYHKAEKADFPAPWGRVRARFSSTNMRDALRGMAKL